MPSSSQSLGKVYLVGAGPGDPDLISLRGAECLRLADVVLYDGLVNPLILKHTNADCERTCRGEGPDGKRIDQAEINRRIVEEALKGKIVVRLKGGDPFIFGRGSEEALALRKAGIEYEIVPGITAAVAAAEYAGISLTHRERASAVAFVTGHEDPAKSDSALDYQALAKFPGTLVFYMGLHRLPQIAASLLREGKPADTPACVISRGTWTLQRTVAGTLQTLPALVKEAKLHAPSLIVVGSCVEMRDELKWFEQRPLFGQRIAIARAESQFDETAALAMRYGAHPVPLPTIEIEPSSNDSEIASVLERLETFDWLVFTSSNGVRFFMERLFAAGRDVRALGGARLAAIGPATASGLRDYHLNADLVPESFRAEDLGAALADHVAGKNVLWLRASRGRDVLPELIAAAGGTLTQLVVYENRDVDSLPAATLAEWREGGIDWLALSSPSIARSLARLIPEDLRPQLGRAVKVVAISPVTADAARECGLPVNVVASEYTWPGIFEAIARADLE